MPGKMFMEANCHTHPSLQLWSERAATHDYIRDDLAPIARDAGDDVVMEQGHVLPPVDGVPE